jgi:hypothetical protein
VEERGLRRVGRGGESGGGGGGEELAALHVLRLFLAQISFQRNQVTLT